MICALILVVTIILSKTKKVGPLIPPKVLKIAIIVEVIGIIATLGEFLTNKVWLLLKDLQWVKVIHRRN